MLSGRRRRRGEEHEAARLASAVDWAITAASRRYAPGGPPVAVGAADVVARAAEDGLSVEPAAALAALADRLAFRGNPAVVLADPGAGRGTLGPEGGIDA